jgi:hypothetical protein
MPQHQTLVDSRLSACRWHLGGGASVTPVSSTALEAGKVFDAVLDEPLVVDGQTVAPSVRSFFACAEAHHSERLVRPHSRPRVVSFGYAD